MQTAFSKEINFNAGMVELVDTLDLGSSAERRGGSTPLPAPIFKMAYAKA